MRLIKEREVHQVLLSVLEKRPEEQRAYLDGEYGHDPELCALVLERLNGVAAMEGAFRDLGSKLEEEEQETRSSGFLEKRVGSYRLVKKLGEGGMGTVYLGERADGEFAMQVAIKVTRKDVTTAELVRRFRHERQIMASLRHPYIAGLYDGGTTEEGYPYFVMEYVDGRPINRFCQEEQLSFHEKLSLFERTCEGVAFAHKKGVIHRDIKPGNILVTAEGVPKLLDFGIASSILDPQFTQGTQQLLTPAYASPEQVLGEAVGYPSDVYALGILLYELVAERSPYAWKGVPRYEMARIICEEIPDPPSVVLVGRGTSFELESQSAHSDLQGLDPLIMKALRKKPHSRYESATEFLEQFRIFRAGWRFQDPDEKPFDAYLCATRQGSAFAQQLANRLKGRLELSVEPETKGCEDLEPEQFSQRLDQARCCVILVGQEKRQVWQYGFLRQALATRVTMNGLKILPFLIEGGRRPGRETALPKFLRNLTWPTLDGIGDERALTQLIAMIEDRVSKSSGQKFSETECPFRGLESFQEKDRSFYFGREALIQRVCQHLEEHPFLAVLGPSGSGKSSMIQAGVIPRLRARGMRIALFTPTANPLYSLAHALFRSGPRFNRWSHPEAFVQAMQRSEDTLLQAVGDLGGDPLCLVIDQFEQVFALPEDGWEREAFLQNLMHAVDPSEGQITLVITLRSDFMGHCAAWPDLNCFLNENLVQVGPMEREDLRKAVEEPARLVGLQFEDGLVRRMLSEAAGASAELPLIQHALLELYKNREGGRLTAAAYTRIGGIEGALARRAEAEYSRLNEEERRVLQDMFVLGLVQPVDGAEDTKRSATRAELMEMGSNPEVVEKLLRAWTEARLLTVHLDEGRNQDVVEVAHEALIRRWERISEWMDENRERARWINRLRQEARRWEEIGRSQDVLPRGIHLLSLQELVDKKVPSLGRLEQDYVAAGVEKRAQEEKEREQRQQWESETKRVLSFRAGVIATVTFMAMIALSVAAWLLWRQGQARQLLLVDSYWRESLDAWEVGDLPLAVHLAGEALKEVPKSSRESLLLHYQRMMEQGSWPLMSFHHQGYVAGASWDHAEARILSWSFDKTLSLWDSATGRKLGPVMRHDDKVWGAAFSPDDRRILSWGFDRSVRLWNSKTGEAVTPPMYHSDSVWGASFCNNGRKVISWGFDGTVRLWDAANGEPVLEAMRHEAAVLGALVREDRARILSWSKDKTVRIWDANQGTPLAVMRHGDWVEGATYDADGGRILSWSRDGTARQWDATTGRPIGKVMVHAGKVNGAHYTDSGQRILTWSDDASVQVWDARTGELLLSPMRHEGKVLGCSESPDGKRILSWSEDHTLRIWDAATGLLQGDPLSHKDKVLGAVFSPDGQSLLSWSLDRSLGFWDTETNARREVSISHGDVILGAAFNASGSHILTWGYDKTVRLWATPEKPKRPPITHSHGEIMGVQMSVDERRLLTFGGQALYLWDVEGQLMGAPMEHEGSIWGAVFDEEERRILSWGRDGTLRLWDAATQRQIGRSMQHLGLVRGASFSSDHTHIWSWGNDGRAIRWNAANQSQVGPVLVHQGQVRGARLNKDEDQILTWTNQGELQLWDAVSGAHLKVVGSHEAAIVGACWAREGQQVLSWGEDNAIRLWRVATAGVQQQVFLHDGIVWGAHFFNDEKRILSWGYDKTVRIWDVLTGAQVGATLFHDDVVLGACLLADDTRILSWGRDKSVRLWDVSMGRQIGPPMRHEDNVNGAWVLANKNSFLSWSGSQIRQWALGADLDLPQTLAELQIQVTTAGEFNPHLWDLRPIADQDLARLREKYLVHGVAHFAECTHREHNLFAKHFQTKLSLGQSPSLAK